MEVSNLKEKLNELTPGSTIINSNNNQDYGVIVNNLNDKLVIFRLEKNTYPVFSKINNHPYIRKTGNINEYKHEILKQALLKYISNNNLTNNEKKLLSKLINYAFPLGIPEYRPEIELPERDQEHLDLASHLVVGKKLFINTPNDSPYKFLNNNSVDIIDIKDNGIWIMKPDNNENNNYFLFFKNKTIPNFSGISRVVPLGEETKYLDKHIENYKVKNNDNQLPTTMIYNGEKVKVQPETQKIIFPIKYQNMEFDINKCKFIEDKVTREERQKQFINDEYNFSDLNRRKDTNLETSGSQIIIGGGSKEDEYILNNMSKMALEKDNIENYKSDIETEDIDMNDSSSILNSDIKEDLEDLEIGDIIKSKLKNTKFEEKSNTSDQISNSDVDSSALDSDLEDIDDFSEENFNFIDEEEVEEKGVFQKVRRIEVEEIEKVYKESIQKGDLFKYKIEQIPKLRRNDINILNKINKEINILTILKHKITGEDNSIKFKPENYNQLLNKYLNKDFTNNLLIPLVLNKKNVYIGKDGKVTESDYDENSNNIIKDYFSRIKEINNLQEKPSINYDTLQNKRNEFMNPTESNNNQLGVLFKLGEGLKKDDPNKLDQDTLTIRYCDKDYNCQSFQLISNDFDCQVNLGPIGRYLPIEKEVINYDDELEDMVREDNKLSNIDYTLGKFKILYSGDSINMIGLIRPPLNYYLNKKNNEMMNMTNMFNELQDDNKDDDTNPFMVINLGNLENLEDENYNIFDHPDKFICFMFDTNSTIDENTLRDDLSKIVPNIENVLKLYDNEINTIEETYDILSNFEFQYHNLDIYEYNQIFNLLEEKKIKIENSQKILQQKYDRKIRKENEINENKDKDKELLEIKTSSSIINDNLFQELLNYYYDIYLNLRTKFDNDRSRLNWFNNRIDNGYFMINNLLLNYYEECERENSVEDLNTNLKILKEEYHKISDERQINYPNNENILKKKKQCESKKIEKPKIVKYPNIGRLEEDNQKVIVDSDGEIIMPGDYGLIKNENGIDLFKRESLSEGDMWIREDIATLHRLINESKNLCESNKPFNLEDDNICLFDEDDIECNPIQIIKIDNTLDDIKAKITDLESYIDFIKSIPDLKKNINSELKLYRNILNQKLENDKRYWKEKLLEFKLEEEEIAKTIVRLNDCIHFGVIDYFNGMKNLTLTEKFSLALSVLDKFRNTEYSLDLNNISDNDNENYCKCNVCNQDLLCKHYHYGAELIRNNIEFDFDKFVNIYGVESGESYYCKICGEFLGNTNFKDIDEFGDGEDGKRIVTREVTENIPVYDLQIEELEKRMDKLSKDQERGEQNELGINIYKLIKMLCNLKGLRIEDEKEMINFIEHFDFIKKSNFKTNIMQKFGSRIKNKTILIKLINKYYYIYYIVDICARFLILIQTSDYLYNLNNKMVKANYMGYPTIDDKNAKDGINLMVSIIQQIGTLEKYIYLNDKDANIEAKLMERINYQIENSEYLRNKIINSIIDKYDSLNEVEEFKNYITNYWLDFRPSLNISLSWTPDKIINRESLKDLNIKNYKSMVNVTYEDSVYEIYKLMKYVNNIINEEEISTELTRRTNLGNSCCKDSISKDNEYFQYFNSKNGEIGGIIKKINKLKEIKEELASKLNTNVYHILFVPIINSALQQFRLDLQPSKDEIKKLFMKYIHTGPNIGKLHIFNNYNQCIISGINKEDKEKMNLDINQFVHLYNIIKNNNQVIKDQIEIVDKQDNELIITETSDIIKKEIVTIEEYDKIKLNIIEEEYILLNNIIDLLPNSEEYSQFNFIYNYLQMIVNKGFNKHINNFNMEKIMEKIKLFRIEHNSKNRDNIDSLQINKNLLNDDLLINQKDQKNKKNKINNKLNSSDNNFNLNKHIALLNSQINQEIENLVNKLNLSNKEKEELDKKLNDIGEYFEHKKELEKNYLIQNKEINYSEINNNRYKIRENNLKKNIKFLKDVLNQINNGKLDNIDDKTKIRPQYRNFIMFNKNKKLFKRIKEYINIFFELNNLIVGREQYEILNIENISCILHYLSILCYLSIYNYLYESGLKDKLGKLIIDDDIMESDSFNPSVQDIDNEYKIIEKDNSEILNDMEIDEEVEEKEMEDRAQKSTNLNIIIEFLKIYLKKIFEDEKIYDSLTDDKIKEVMAKHQQKQQERNLKIFSFLSKEGHEEDYNMILNKLSIGKLGFKDLSEYMNQVYGDQLFEVNDIGDAVVDDNDLGKMEDIDVNDVQNMMDNERKNNELGLLNEEVNEIGFIGDPDEGMEEQDYGGMIGDYD